MAMTNSNENSEAQQSLESVASPEQLDQLMQVVKPKDFIATIAVGAFTVITLIWSIVGRIPITVTGQGVLTSSQRVLELQSPISGQLESLLIQDNQCVKKGEVLAIIKPTELEKQLILQLKAFNNRKNELAEVKRAIAQLEQQIKERGVIHSPQEGCVLDVGIVEGQVVNPGTRLGTLQTSDRGHVQLNSIAYFDVRDGKRIKPGMKMQITPDTVKRERFGGIVATVKSVSAYPVASSTVASKLGNTELADAIAGKTPKMEVIAELMPEPKNFSGYKWSSSQGPDMKLTAGTTTALRVTVEERAPITFLLPFLREWSGLQ